MHSFDDGAFFSILVSLFAHHPIHTHTGNRDRWSGRYLGLYFLLGFNFNISRTWVSKEQGKCALSLTQKILFAQIDAYIHRANTLLSDLNQRAQYPVCGCAGWVWVCVWYITHPAQSRMEHETLQYNERAVLSNHIPPATPP